MAITLYSAPGNTPSSLTDWQNLLAQLQIDAMAINNPFAVDGTTIRKGYMFFVQGAWYKTVSDTNISGTQSPYVRLSVSGSSLVPAFVSSLSGVSWSTTWNDYYDASNNLYIFDEIKAYVDGVLSVFPYRVRNFKPIDREALGLLYAGFSTTGWYNLLTAKNPDPYATSYSLVAKTALGGDTYDVTKSKYFAGTSLSYQNVATFSVSSAPGTSFPMTSFYYEASGFPVNTTIKIYSGSTIYYEGTVMSGSPSVTITVDGTVRTISVDAKQLISAPTIHTGVIRLAFGYTGTHDIVSASTFFIAGDMLR